MTDLLGKLTAAIIRQEGMPPDHTNPGNLRAAPWELNPIIAKGYWVPATRAEGIAGIYHVIALHIARGQNLYQLINTWAPPSDNNPTSQYLANVQKWTGIDNLIRPLWTYLEQPDV